MTIASAAISMSVSSTLNFTLSPTPRRLISASSTMNASATTSVAPSPVGTASMPSLSPTSRLLASRPDEVEALVMPEHTTVKATRKVMKCTPNALCV